VSTVRLRRLQSDFEKLQDYVRRHPRIKLLSTQGDPPESYQLEYRLRSLRRVDEDLKEVKAHQVEITLPGSYPRLPPLCRMLTPIFHPNIAPHAICIGDHWSAGEPLWGIVARIGEMIAYQSYNTKSPLNGEAARWVAENEERLPLDPVSMIVEERPDEEQEQKPKPPPVVPVTTPKPPEEKIIDLERVITLTCPECRVVLRVGAGSAGKRARCPKCRTIVTVPQA